MDSDTPKLREGQHEAWPSLRKQLALQNRQCYGREGALDTSGGQEAGDQNPADSRGYSSGGGLRDIQRAHSRPHIPLFLISGLCI